MDGGLVLDASVTLSWCYADEQNDYAYRVLDELQHRSARVPGLWALEVGNGLVVGERRNRLSLADVSRFIELLAGLSLVVDAQTAERAFTHALPLARTHALSVYDAVYLELAMRENLLLATLDDKLRIAAAASGVVVF
jgi:predicted nucleic acid-binding protein